MNIMVFDVAAESGGALSILDDFYKEVDNYNNKDINWYFILSKAELKEKENIKVLNFPKIKKSWFHRIHFDYVETSKLIKENKIDFIISLQNIIIPNTRTKQIIYLHNSLPFADYRFRITEDAKLWIYQNVISRLIYNSVNKAYKVIVQTDWMKEKCSEIRGNSYKDDILVVKPKINKESIKEFKYKVDDKVKFFYPASSEKFKNHQVIIDACKLLKKDNIKNYEVIFTIKEDENEYVKRLQRQIKEENLPIRFIGVIDREKVMEYYSKCILVFPSYIETVGLPLLEARLSKCIIVSSDCSFSKDALKGYENSYKFKYDDCTELYRYMKNIILKKLNYIYKYDNFNQGENSILNTVLKILKVRNE